MRLTHLSRDMGGCLADQLQISQGSVIDESFSNERFLVQSIRIRQDFFAKFDHILNIEPPTTLSVGESKGRDKEGYTPLVRKAKITRLIFNANLPPLHTD